ncbi:alpha/beta hydrolase [Brucepastera parasyntrophica]|uniref:alpha/beta hydrolase n=1 Tax=Brucepastera parasyntrophica TaxID=2880008 RepID=UPI00210DE282|nr:alpha/beta hydrolase [Brucepastera parasyntrophica]ULQ60470.1 alpha/beta hydrolase [Brucepastera parasyntrophica]
MKAKAKNMIIVLGIFFLILIVAGFIAGNILYNLAINPKSDKSAVFDAPENVVAGSTEVNPEALQDRQEEKEWFNSIGYENIYLESKDRLRLHAYMIPNKNKTGRWAILCHGYTSVGTAMIKPAMTFYNMDFNILIPEARGHGMSEGNYIGMGWHDRLDIVSWINEIVRKDKDAEIILYGVSMGGTTVMMVSGEELPENVKAIIEDCGYSSVWEELAYQMKTLFRLPAFPVLYFASAVTGIRAGYTLGEADAVKQVAKTKTPMLFIHGDSDTFVPPYMLDKVYNAAGGPKEKLIVRGAGHGAAALADSAAYWETVKNFIDRFLS